MGQDLLYKVAYDEAVRTLSEQQTAVESFRSRAGLLLSTSAVTTSFLGAQAIKGGGSKALTWLALLGFVGAAATSLVILWPRRWELSANPRNVVESYIESSEAIQIEGLYRALSLRMHRSYLENQRGLRSLAVYLQAASGLLTVEVILWIAAIAPDL